MTDAARRLTRFLVLLAVLGFALCTSRGTFARARGKFVPTKRAGYFK